MNWPVLFSLLANAGLLVWLYHVTERYHRDQGLISRLEAKARQYSALLVEMQQLIDDEKDLDKCLQEEIDGRKLEDARDVRYEQNLARGEDEEILPWVPIARAKKG